MKAVLPVAGLGTRFLPVTKAVPKEMLPILDRPCIEYVVAEAVASGIDELVFVTARGKGAIEEYFDQAPALEATLEAAGKRELLCEVRRVAQLATVVSIRQASMKGLGHAVLTAAPAVGNHDFVVILPDDIVDAEVPVVRQLLDVHADTGGVVVALKEVPRADTRRYGICAGPMVRPDRMRIDHMVEKPRPEDAPSNLSIVGRYVLPGAIFEELRRTEPGAGGEIQLTDALARMPLAHGHVFSGAHFDTGNPVGLLGAALHFGTRHPVMGPAVRALAAKFAAN
ncbi:MAG: UTP--glucose-1-phosphate uridylyltransferase [Deltaproteobacteria bacterium]|nr:UTP--glucose-1-phosphate uridylyltransferase [Deltaproteobacteria bacterium]